MEPARPPEKPFHRRLAPTALTLGLVAWCLALAVVTGADTHDGSVPPWPPEGRVLPADLVEGRFFLDLTTADGESLRLFTDTGGGMALRPSAAARLGLTGDDGETAGPGAGVELPPLADGSWIPAPSSPLWMAPEEGTPLFLPDGMLGAPWFQGRTWTFDYADGRLILHEPPGDGVAPPAGHSVDLGFQRADDGSPTTGFPRVTVTLAGEAVDLLFDTGATGEPPPAFGDPTPTAVSFIARSVADRWRSEHPEWTVVGEGADGAAEAGDELPDGYWIRVPEVEIAGLEAPLPLGPAWFQTKPDANFHDFMSQWMDRPVDGALGGNALTGLRVTLDYPGARATFVRPATDGADPPPADLDGLKRARRLSDAAFDAYRAGHHAEAGRLMAHVAELGLDPVDGHYNAACAFALAGDGLRDRAWYHLRAAVAAGLHRVDLLRTDSDLEALRGEEGWAELVADAEANARRHETRAGDPANARLVTADLERFWRAYDAAAEVGGDVEEAAKTYRRLYLEPGSRGLLQFYDSRIESATALARKVEAHRPYYDAIRPQLRLSGEQEEAIRAAFRRLEEIYPPAIFPDVYFLVGRLNSGGTTSADALLIGMEMHGLGPATPPGVIPPGSEEMVKPAPLIPHIVAHELIHAQQGGGSSDLLYRALREGGADFLADLIHPQAEWEPNYRTWGRAHADLVRERFLTDRQEGDPGRWFYNYADAGDDWFPDLGYYVGYEIARRYYAAAENKTEAVRELILLRDPEAIFTASRYGSQPLGASRPRS